MMATLLALAAEPAPVPAPRVRGLPGWTGQLQGKGWPFLDIDPAGAVVLFAKTDPAEAEPGRVRVLVRHEFQSEQTDPVAGGRRFRSEVISQAVDCAARTIQLRRAERYPFANLEGQPLRYRFSDVDWRAPDPGSFDEEVLEDACRGGPTAP